MAPPDDLFFWLPDSVVFLIIEKIESIYDYARFSLVCKSWYSVARAHYSALIFRSNLQKKQLPFLLIPHNYHDDHRWLHTVIGWKTLQTQLHIPMMKKKFCCGSAYGWLFFADEIRAITLYNPFTSDTILLPPVGIPKISSHDEILKVALSADPYVSPNSFELVALHGMVGGMLYYQHTKNRTNNWMKISRTELQRPYIYLQDVIHHRGKFYAVGDQGVLLVQVENNGDGDVVGVKFVDVLPQISKSIWHMKVYLAESSKGCLFFIARYYIPHTQEGYFEIHEQHFPYDFYNHKITKSFQVYEFDTTKTEKYLKLIDSIGYEAIFIGGFNDSISVVASGFSGCQSNCIYYADDMWWGTPYDEESELPYDPYGPIDFGFFRVGEDEPNPRYMLHLARRREPAPLWIIPTLKFTH